MFSSNEYLEVGEHFGQSSQAELNDLNKALSAEGITGQQTVNNPSASGSPLKMESLNATLKVLLYKRDSFKVFQNIPKETAYNTVEEFNQLTSYGSQRGGFSREGELPEEEDSIYARRSELVKFMGITKSITHPMTLVRTNVGNIVTREIENATLWILRQADRAMVYGDANIIPEQWNGIYAQQKASGNYLNLDDYFNSDLVVDLRGQKLSEIAIENAANNVVNNFGLATALYAPPKVLSDFVTNFYGNKFIQPNTNALTNGVMGQKVKSFESQFGNIDLNFDVHLIPEKERRLVDIATSAKAPLAPTTGSATPVATDASSKFLTADAGNYFYAVSALNRYGESALTLVSASAAAAVAGGSVDLIFTNTASTYPATGFRIYRTKKDAVNNANTLFYPIFDVSLQNLVSGYDGGVAGTVRDRNRFLTDCQQAYLLEDSNDIYAFKQLAPLMKMDLAILGPAQRFMTLLYGTPQLYQPKKMVRFINIGKI